ncbi:YggS family pyridoxal phosphate-dependent enzyme [Fundidesulfovibrio butyratiphilus]
MHSVNEAAKNLATVRARIDAACQKCGRSPGDVTLVAVSKTHPAQRVRDMADAGQRLFGESYVQEAVEKIAELADPSLTWHFIGRLQKNKVKYVAGLFDLIHTVDSLDLARLLHEKSAQKGVVQKVLMQVNLAAESQKAGCPADQAEALARAVRDFDALRLEGLMVLPPFGEDGEVSRPWFSGLRELRDRLENALGAGLGQLSMGMSHDLEQAVEEGATLVRVGTDLFGERESR